MENMKKNSEKKSFLKKDISKATFKEKILPNKNAFVLLWRGIVVFVFLLVLTYILIPSFPTQLHNLEMGSIASKNIKANEDYLVEDKILTEKNGNEAVENSLPVFDYNPNTIEEIKTTVSSALSIMQQLYTDSYPDIYKKLNEVNDFLSASNEVITIEERIKYQRVKNEIDQELFVIESSSYFAEKELEFKVAIGVDLSKKSLKTLKWHHYNPKIVNHIQDLLTPVFDKGVISSRKTLNQKNNRGILIRDINSGIEHTQKNLFEIKDFQESEAYLNQEVMQVVDKTHRSLQRVILLISKGFIQSNLTFNSSETEIRKKKAAEMVKPVFFQVKKGEMIVREGEKISQEHLIKLNGLSSKMNRHKAIFSITGLFIFIVLIGFLLWSYLKRFKPSLINKKPNIILLAVVLLGNIIICKLFISIAHALSEYTGYIETQSYYYAIPYVAGPMLIAMLFEVDIAILFSIATFVLTGLMLEGQIYYALFALTGSLCVVFRESQYVGRLSILGTGFFVSMINMITVIPIFLINASSFSIQLMLDIAMGFMGGVIVAVVVSSLLPVLEYLFGVTSDIKLLELSNLNHHLLRDMLIHAPGTYQHSMVVGSLAEEAAKSVNSNYLLARVGSYYHDIGKMKKPEYFIENIMGGSNKHDKLNPSMSSLIITSHVKDGVELARKYKLQPGIVDFISEHHGTDIIRYFYNKAKEKEYPKLHSIKGEHFRYPGPKPQKKETAIVMLADSVEAASRTLVDPTPSRIQGLVEKIINEKFIDGQLDKCSLTLKDLHNIANSFVRILNGMFHSRINYPENVPFLEVKDRRGIGEDTHSQSTKENKIKSFQNKKGSSENIKQFGLP